MALTFSTSDNCALGAAERLTLLETARTAILCGRSPVAGSLDGYTPALRAPAATFVTLHVGGALRGCIGTLDPFQPLVVDTAENAYAAAYRDPRFPALTEREFGRLDIHIAVLGTPEPLAFTSEQDLIARLRPGVDGLILHERGRRGTFLPSVWDAIPDPCDFLAQLKRKAGLAPDYWSGTIRVFRYDTVSIP